MKRGDEASQEGGSGIGTAVDRRAVLGAIAGATSASIAGCSAFDREADDGTVGVEDDRARELAEQFAPNIYFDANEKWFPTDPRPYESERDGETVVDGFDALDGYHERYDEDDSPPDPTVFYHAVAYEESPLAVIQFWFYSTFDQFTTNFHWHDWEVLHVFVDTEREEPRLYVASSHSRSIPNNEFLDPDPEMTPRILSELGSHSSTLSVNQVPDHFQRISTDGLLADITNTAIEGIEDLADIPLAYGLPRDEGSRLPYLVPEYEGRMIYEHDRLPSVTRESLIDEELTVRSFDAIESVPSGLPGRETGLVFGHADRTDGNDGGSTDGGETNDNGTGATNDDGDGSEGSDEETEAIDVEYELVSISEIEHITEFTGPQLSFEFTVPEAIEDAMAGHITTTGTPWSQPRYENPAADITSPTHRQSLAEEYTAIGEAAPIHTVLAHVTSAVTDDDAPDGEGITTTESSVESVALLESEPEAIPTFGGIAAVQDVPSGDHRLTVNGAGRAPHGEQIAVPDDESTTTVAGVEGEIPLVAREHARKMAITDEEADIDLSRVAVEDDFGGRVYDSSVDGSDAVYVHAGGAYTTELRDVDDAIGAHRVNPDPESEEDIRIDRPETGKASLATFIADIAAETRAEVAEIDEDDGDDDPTTEQPGGSNETEETTSGGSTNAITGLQRALQAVVESARAASERARAGDRGGADQRLMTVAERLERVSDRLAEAEADLPNSLSNATQNRLDQATRRAEQARDATKL
ncbi:hypothetical protein ACERIT_14105 [Halopenitus sp. H-Gu1]|uniref:hypothetical protein n=1 Tax=Halopenitus sp. H-Gu1 TaxID=3242697 RepID=UPI00359E3BA4